MPGFRKERARNCPRTMLKDHSLPVAVCLSATPLDRGPLLFGPVFPAFPALVELPLPPPRRGSPGDPVPLGTSVLWKWLTPLRVLLAPMPLAPTQQNVTSVPEATTVFRG